MPRLKAGGNFGHGLHFLTFTCAVTLIWAFSQDPSVSCQSSEAANSLETAVLPDINLENADRKLENAGSFYADPEADTVSYIQAQMRITEQLGSTPSQQETRNVILLAHRQPVEYQAALDEGVAGNVLSADTNINVTTGGAKFWGEMQHVKNMVKESMLKQSIPNQGLDPWDRMDVAMLSAAVVFLIGFDSFVLMGLKQDLSCRIIVLTFMLAVSAVYMALVWKMRGASDGKAWAAGYVIECALSMDNLFVIHIVLKAFAVPSDQAQFAVIMGFYGAVILRVFFILGLSAVLHFSNFFFIVIGILLIVSGFLALRDDEELDVTNLWTVQICKYCLGDRLLDRYDSLGRAVVFDGKGFRFTVLFLVICVIMVVDVFFAVDSVGSKTGEIINTYINLSSSLMAMFSLRALFFIIRSMAGYFELLKYGICTILVLLGVEMVFSSSFQVDLGVMGIIVTAILGVSILASVVFKAMSSNVDHKDSSFEDSVTEKQ